MAPDRITTLLFARAAWCLNYIRQANVAVFPRCASAFPSLQSIVFWNVLLALAVAWPFQQNMGNGDYELR